MKKAILYLTLFSGFIPVFTWGQSWQWGKRGGAMEGLSTENIEQTYSLVTDSHKNIYGLSKVGAYNLNIDNNVKTNFDTGFYPMDYALFSFGCDGSYRWSKIIGGMNKETVHPLQIDNQNNIYLAGRFLDCTSDSNYPPRIDNDFINAFQDCRLFFIAKYNDSGVLQWLKRPEAIGVDTFSNFTYTSGFQTDASGNSYWLLYLPPGTYADGAFVNSQAGNHWFILKYDMNGNYTGNIPLDMQTTAGYLDIHFQRNPYNNHFYFYASDSTGVGTAVIGGNAVNHNTFFASFDEQGNFLWKREDSFDEWGRFFIYNLAFDPQNNIYIGGKMIGYNMGSFLGYSIPDEAIPGFVMKTNPDASQVLWASNNNMGSENFGGIVLNGNELGYTSYCAGADFTWGTQTLNASNLDNNEGVEVLLARFNKDSGACIGLTKLPGSPGYYDVGTAITVDASGDYIVGGAVGGTMYFNNNQQIMNSGAQSDFFVAKYAIQACSPLGTDDQAISAVALYPNPTHGKVYFDNNQGSYRKVTVYSSLGQILMEQSLRAGTFETIDVSSLSVGLYILRFEGSEESISVKLIKE